MTVATARNIETTGTAVARRGPRLAYRRPAPPATVAEVIALLDDAHADLHADDLAAVLMVVLREAEILRRGALPARPRGRLREGRPPLTPVARAALRPIRQALAEVARTPVAGRSPNLVVLGERVAAHAEFVGGLPKGCTPLG
jgi:hypothetical protein